MNRFWLHTAYSSTPTATQLKALSDAVSAAWRTRFLGFMYATVHLVSQRTVLYVDSTTEVAIDGSDAGTGSGSGAGNAPQVCLLLNWSISGAYRGGHPRTYLPGPTTSIVEADGTIPGGTQGTISTAAGNFLSDVNALSPTPFTTVQLGTIAFFRGHAALAPPVFKPFLSGACHPRGATQRRRART